jgi:hypothetical protein
MAAKKKPPKPATGPPTVHEATLASGPSGAVLKGPVIDLVAAIARRQAGLDIVVCGDETKANKKLAWQIEAAVGPCDRQVPHDEAGPNALPHFQPRKRPPAGHSFYETGSARRKARKKQP